MGSKMVNNSSYLILSAISLISFNSRNFLKTCSSEFWHDFGLGNFIYWLRDQAKKKAGKFFVWFFKHKISPSERNLDKCALTFTLIQLRHFNPNNDMEISHPRTRGARHLVATHNNVTVRRFFSVCVGSTALMTHTLLCCARPQSLLIVICLHCWNVQFSDGK